MAETRESCAETPLAAARRWDTATVDPAEAFEFYREGICAAFMPLRPELESDRRQRFRARVTSYGIGDGALNLVAARSHRVCKGPAEIAASPVECYYLNYQLAGECRIAQNGAEIVLRRGETGLFDGVAPFDLDHRTEPELGVASWLVPKRCLPGMAEDGAPVVLSQHPVFGRLLSEAARTLALSVSRLAGAERLRLSEIIYGLAAMCGTDAAEAAPETRSAAQFERVRGLIRQNCRNPGFGAADCAALAGLSAGYIHELFARNGDRFGASLLRERLRIAAALLRDPARRHQPVASLAWEAGFGDASHFGRVFRRAYGCAPGAWRRDGQ